MVDISGFNANDVDMTNEFDSLPVGRYHAEIVNCEERDIGRDGEKGTKLTFQWKVVTGPCEGRMIWQDVLHAYNVEGEKGDKTRENATKDLSAICLAVGKPAPKSTDELLNIPCMIKVVVKKGTNGYEDSTQVAGFGQGATKIGAAGSNVATRSAPPAQQQRAASSGGGGWKRSA